MDLGIYKSFWDGHPNHLPFLNLLESGDAPKEWNLDISLSKLYTITESSSKESIHRSIELLLESENWRTHLVAVLTMLAVEPALCEDHIIGLFWERLSKGSWVSSQILVALSLIDREFEAKARQLVMEGFKVSYSKLPPVDHHVARGGIPSSIAEKKVKAAIDYLLNGIVNDTYDSDCGGSIARNWQENLMRLIEQGKIKFKRY